MPPSTWRLAQVSGWATAAGWCSVPRGCPGRPLAARWRSSSSRPRPADLAPLLVSGYGLSARERAVAEQVLEGRSTAQVAVGLGITPYTVRDHLKAIFAKVGVRSRRELGQALAARTGSLTVG